jgi:hypothetical protein
MVLQEENAAIYAWSAEDSAAVTAAAPTVYNPLNDPLVAGIGVATSTIFRQATDPAASAQDGDLWIDTSVTPNIARARIAGAWQVAANYVTQGTDIGVANGATKNTLYRQSSAPGSPIDGDLWVDTSVTPNVTKVRISGAWQVGANYVTQGTDIGVANGATATTDPAVNANPNFYDYPAATGFPTGFANNQNQSAANTTRVAGSTSLYAMQVAAAAATDTSCFSQIGSNADSRFTKSQWVTIEADIRLVSGVLTGAGVELQTNTNAGAFDSGNSIVFSTEIDPSTGAAYGAGTAGQDYVFRKTVQVGPAAFWAYLYPRTSNSGYGSIAAARTIIWRRVAVRPASDAEKAGKGLVTPGSGQKVGDARNLPNIIGQNLSYKINATPTYSASAGTPATATISMPAFSLYYGSQTISYNSSSANVSGTGGTTVTYFLYIDDPANAGGSQTLNATTTGNTIYQADGRILVGSVDVFFPVSGSGSGGGGGGGGGFCVAADAWVETRNRGFVRARTIEPGDMLRVLTDDREGTEWTACTGNSIAPAPVWRIVSVSGIEATVSEETPIVLRDGSIVAVAEVGGEALPVLDRDGFRWEDCHAEPAGAAQVAKILCNQRTYAAGDAPGRSILTHNPKP